MTTGGAAAYRRLLADARRHFGMLLFAVAGMLLDAGAQSGFIWLLKPLIDQGFAAAAPAPSAPWLPAAWLPAAILLLVVMRSAGYFAGVYGVERVGRQVVTDLRARLFGHYLVLPAAFYDRHSAGELISRITYNTDQVAQAATQGLITLVRDSLTATGLIAVMLLHSPLLATAVLLVAPVVAVVVLAVSHRFRRLSHRIQQTMGDVTQVTEEAVNGWQVVKIHAGESDEQARFALANSGARRLHLRLIVNQLISSTVIQWCAGAALVLILWLATASPWAGRVSPGAFVSVLAAMIAVIPPLKRLATIHATIQKGIAAAESVYQILAVEPESIGGGYRPAECRGEVVFEQVTFSYPGARGVVLNEIDLTLAAGRVTALVGRSGSGKTTLASLLPRFYDPSAGRILLDGRDLRDWDLAALRARIAYVGQDVVLFNDTIARNIAYGALAGASPAAVEAAARAAHVLEFAGRLPAGLDTVVGDRGHLLSGGERQRLALARALLKDAPILILDEATSALDRESEIWIQEALERLLAGRTTLVIAHRLATIEHADQIVVLDRGRLVESGTHVSLLARHGLYRTLYDGIVTADRAGGAAREAAECGGA